MADRDYLLEALLGSYTRTVDGAFRDLLEREINIPPGVREQASKSQIHLRDFLASKTHSDSTFPRVLSKADDDFLGGSFARHTKVKPLDDIDLYVPLDGSGLIYTQGGVRLPYTVLSDEGLTANPLLSPRWMNWPYISSKKLVTGFAAVLKEHYSQTSIRPNGQAVTMRMDELGYDVVPCFSMQPDNANEYRFYLIPDGNDGWLRTNPRLDTEVADLLHRRNGRVYRKAVRLIKHWNSTTLSGAFASYYLEHAIALALLKENSAGRFMTQVSHGVTFGFLAVAQAVRTGNLSSWISGAPPVTPGKAGALESILLNGAATRAEAASTHERTGRTEAAIQEWRHVFGDSFGR